MLRRLQRRMHRVKFPLILIVLVLSPLLAMIPLSTQAASAPQIILDNTSGYYDTSIRIRGYNFSPNSEVRIKWGTLSFWEIYCPTDRIGAFDLMSNVPDGLNAGTYALTATDNNGKNASANFAVNAVFLNSQNLGIKTPTQYVKWTYTNNAFYCDTWKMYHTSQNNWYDIMANDYGIYILRLTYNGTTYVYDLAGGIFNAWPKPLTEKVSDFAITEPGRIQGKISISDPTGVVLLATILVDIRAANPWDNYYPVIFSITSEANLQSLDFYVAYNLNLCQPPNSALYDKTSDSVYQYYGPSHFGYNIPEQYLAVAGFGPVGLASTHHEVDIDYTKILYVASKLGYNDFDYPDKDEVHGDAFGNCATGFQCTFGTMSVKRKVTLSVVFASSSTSVEEYMANVAEGKSAIRADTSILPAATLGLLETEGPGTTIAQVVGENFMPHASISLDFGGISVGSFTSNANGVFSGNFIVPTSIRGTYMVAAKDTYGVKATCWFNVTDLTLQSILDRLNSMNVTITQLVTDSKGELNAMINTANGNILAKLNDINGSLVGITNNQNVLNAKIDTLVGTVNAKFSEISATVTGVVTSAKGELLARIDSKVGETLVKVDQINATLAGIIGDAKGDVLARIDTKVGETLVKVDQINATLVGIIGDAKGDVLARIDSKVGETLVKVSEINATLVEIIGNAKGDVLARIDSRVGETLLKVDQINATLSGIIGNAKGDILARIDTNVGTALVKLDTISGALSGVSGNIATIQTSLGKIQVSLNDINATVTRIEKTTATVQTSLGTLTGEVVSIQGDLVTIQTDLGTLNTNTKLVRSDFSLQPIVIAAVIEVAAISGIVYTIWAYRKREISKKELIVAEASNYSKRAIRRAKR